VFSRLLQFLRLYPANLQARDQAIREARKIGFSFEGSFENWKIPVEQSFAKEALRHDPKEFESDCEKELARIVRVVSGRYKLHDDGKNLDYRRIWTSDQPDLWIRAKLRGVGIAGGPYHSLHGRTGKAMSGARVSGSVSFCAGDHLDYSRSFSGVVSPPNSIPDYRAWGGPPFVEAISAACVEDLVKKMLSRFYESPE